ncbi:DoxX family protein [Streptacidiphilus monticola]|uniref:DoxX family protein n=1 Tax=Streptacidiphilus monticola TaxID=2161674 RepID=A0ABW1G9F5_9ACTN
MAALVLAGRILFVLLFLSSGVNHLTRTQQMAGYTESRGVPAARIAVLASGALLLVGSVFVVLGIWPDLGALLLAAFLAPTAVLMHGFWKERDSMGRQQEQVHFLKDTALFGACLMLIAFFAHTGHQLGLTVTGPLFHLD